MAVRRWVGPLLLAAACLVGRPVAAQEPLPVIRIETTEPPQVFFNDCVQPPEVETRPGSVVLSRTGDITGSLSVAYEVTGPVAPTSGVVVFEAGLAATAIELTPDAEDPNGPIEVIVIDGEEYQLGEPSSASLSVAIAVPGCLEPTTTVTTSVPTTSAPPTTTGARPTTSVLARTGPSDTTGPATTGALVVGLTSVIVGSAFVGTARRLGRR